LSCDQFIISKDLHPPPFLHKLKFCLKPLTLPNNQKGNNRHGGLASFVMFPYTRKSMCSRDRSCGMKAFSRSIDSSENKEMLNLYVNRFKTF